MYITNYIDVPSSHFKCYKRLRSFVRNPKLERNPYTKIIDNPLKLRFQENRTISLLQNVPRVQNEHP